MGEEKIYDELGSLLLFNKATEDDIDLLMQLVARGKYGYLELLNELVSSPEAFICLLDVMAGVKTVFPERRKLYKTLEKVFIYNYCADRGFSEDSYKVMSKQYGKRVPQVKAIVATMEKFLETQGTKDNVTYDIEEDTFRVGKNGEVMYEEKVYKE